MNKGLNCLLAAAMSISIGTASAVEVPKSGSNDARIRYVDYQIDNVVLVNVRRGTMTRIVFAADEKIEAVSSGFLAECEKDESEWCLKADLGTSQVFITPQEHATFNNLEIRTNKRDYSLEFRVLADAPNGRFDGKRSLADEPISRLIFNYPHSGERISADAVLGDIHPKRDSEEELRTALAAMPKVRNSNYTFKVGKGADDIKPSMVFDDGRSTYFKFPKNRQLPAIFMVDAKGIERRVNFTMETDELKGVQRLSRQFVLRQDDAVVGIWNEAYDGDGVAATEGVTVDGVKREIKNEE